MHGVVKKFRTFANFHKPCVNERVYCNYSVFVSMISRVGPSKTVFCLFALSQRISTRMRRAFPFYYSKRYCSSVDGTRPGTHYRVVSYRCQRLIAGMCTERDNRSVRCVWIAQRAAPDVWFGFQQTFGVKHFLCTRDVGCSATTRCFIFTPSRTSVEQYITRIHIMCRRRRVCNTF